MHHVRLLGRVALTIGALALAGSAGAQAPGGTPLKPIEPVEAIIDAFDSHDIVALDEGRHRNEQAHHLRLKLVRHRAFAGRVNDIVVEFGNARYQAVMDRYVRGEHVPVDDLRPAWRFALRRTARRWRRSRSAGARRPTRRCRRRPR